MQQQYHSFEELETRLLDKLRDQGCSPVTITSYRYLCSSVFKWLKENGYRYDQKYFGARIGNDYPDLRRNVTGFRRQKVKGVE